MEEMASFTAHRMRTSVQAVGRLWQRPGAGGTGALHGQQAPAGRQARRGAATGSGRRTRFEEGKARGGENAGEVLQPAHHSTARAHRRNMKGCGGWEAAPNPWQDQGMQRQMRSLLRQPPLGASAASLHLKSSKMHCRAQTMLR